MLDQKLLFYTPTLELTPQIHSRFHTYSPLVLSREIKMRLRVWYRGEQLVKSIRKNISVISLSLVFILT